MQLLLPRTFTTPVDIQRLVAATDNAEYALHGHRLRLGAATPSAAGEPGERVHGVARRPAVHRPEHRRGEADIDEDAVDFFGPRLDVRAPELTVPANLTVERDEPRGRDRELHRDRDRQHRRQPQVTCTPASGSVFAIASTPVRCTATDDRGNAAEKTFTVTVLGAGPQLANLVTAVVGENPALRALLSGLDLQRPLHRTVACVSLRTFATLARLLAPDARRGVDRRRQPDPGGARLLNLSRGRGGAGPGARRCR